MKAFKDKNGMQAGGLLLLSFLFVCHLFALEDITLKTDRGAFHGDDARPLGVGVPLKEGMVKDVSQVGIVGKSGALPVHCEARTRWADGSVQWLWADFAGAVEDEYRLTVGAKAEVPAGMSVTESKDEIIVANKAMRLTWSRQHAMPCLVELAVDGRSQTIASGDGDGVYVIEQTGARCVLGGEKAELMFDIETRNALRTVIRVEGWFVRGDGERVARGVVRFDCRLGQPWMKVEHTLVLTRDNDEVWFKEVALRFPVQTRSQASALFGIAGEKARAVPCAAKSEAYVFQAQHPIYHRRESECVVGLDAQTLANSREAEGWADVGDGGAGVMVAVRDFAPQFPKELTADAGGITAKLWTSRDGRVLDYNTATLVKDWWGEWAQQVSKMPPKDVGLTEPMTVEKIAASNPSCVGVARTHELFVGWYAGAQDEARSRTWHARFQNPPVVYPDPKWTCHVDERVFWPMAAKGEFGPQHAELEDFITRWFDEFMVRQELFPMSGWYDWMKLPLLRWWKDESQGNRVYAQWYRSAIDGLYEANKFITIGWARSGDRRLLDAARRFNRWQTDNKVVHWGGGRDKRVRGYLNASPSQFPPSWRPGSGKLFTGYDTELVTGPALEYLLCDSRQHKDSIALMKAAALEHFSTDPKVLTDSPDMSLAHLIALHRVLPDDKLRAIIDAAFAAFTDRVGPIGMKESYWSAFGGHYTADYKLNRKALAIAEYAALFGGNAAHEIAAKAALGAHGYKNTWSVCYYCEFFGASNAFASRWRTPAPHLAAAQYQLDELKKLFAAYRRIPAEQTGAAHFIATIYPYCGPSSGTYVFKDLPDKANESGRIAFSTETAGVPFLSVPMAVWAVEQEGRQ